MLDETSASTDGSSCRAACRVEFVVTDQPLIVCINQVIQDFSQRTARDSQELSELLVLEATHVAFSDVPGCGTDRVI